MEILQKSTQKKWVPFNDFCSPTICCPKKNTTATSAGESAAWFRTQNSQGVWAGKGICMSSVYSYVKCEIYIVKICIHDI